jgi:hypothetical protein
MKKNNISIKDLIMILSISSSAIQTYLMKLELKNRIDSLKHEFISKISKLEGELLNTKEIIVKKMTKVKEIASSIESIKHNTSSIKSEVVTYNYDPGIIIKYLVIGGFLIGVTYISYVYILPYFTAFSGLINSVNNVKNQTVEGVKNVGNSINSSVNTIKNDLSTVQNDITNAQISLNNSIKRVTEIDLNVVKINRPNIIDSVENSSIENFSLDSETIIDVVKDVFN